jgi:hypothetical protein
VIERRVEGEKEKKRKTKKNKKKTTNNIEGLAGHLWGEVLEVQGLFDDLVVLIEGNRRPDQTHGERTGVTLVMGVRSAKEVVEAAVLRKCVVVTKMPLSNHGAVVTFLLQGSSNGGLVGREGANGRWIEDTEDVVKRIAKATVKSSPTKLRDVFLKMLGSLLFLLFLLLFVCCLFVVCLLFVCTSWGFFRSW